MTRAWVDIDLGALMRNGETFARAAGVPLLPMVKGDAYGLGMLRVVDALLALRPWGFGVSSVIEGEELRRAGITLPVLVFSPLLPADFDAARRAELRPVLGDPAAITEWVRVAAPWHLSIDTGMSRAGISWRDVHLVRDLVHALPPEGVCTHFLSAELPDGSRERQEQRFRDALATLGIRPAVVHADNSPSVEHRSPSPYDLARPGIFLYGVSSGHDATIMPEPVASVRARVVEVRVVQPGDTVSYDATWTAPRAGRIATISLGYADGYRRAFGNRARALLHGKRVPVVGNVTMDLTMLDVTDHPCTPGDVVTLLGRDGDDLITVNELAEWGQLSPYELLAGLRLRLPHCYSTPAA